MAAQPRHRTRRHPSASWRTRGRRAAAALALTAATLVAGAAPSSALAPDGALAAPAASESTGEESLRARLTAEYAGAVPAADVASLVAGVTDRLQQDASPTERLLRTAEAICRRALTDHLARGVPLPPG
ncbi:hypothetical protein KUV85_09875 [Nocardioides panacisoli]|uniref:hypothetical protein n=1 Tax=Nocardioides panacisoli TaxID=627624 RepID=UPI001C635AF4|nr:hypothetical protein [Nocardioides panacisoli]QYJ02649.1 hypothetical protein KUV85_09875 [Nocardioides panacisoli]